MKTRKLASIWICSEFKLTAAAVHPAQLQTALSDVHYGSRIAQLTMRSMYHNIRHPFSLAHVAHTPSGAEVGAGIVAGVLGDLHKHYFRLARVEIWNKR